VTRMARRVQARPPLSAADVEDRKLVRAESAVFESSTRAQLEAAIAGRTWDQSCASCGSVLIFTGSLDGWLSKSMAWDDVHDCEAVA